MTVFDVNIFLSIMVVLTQVAFAIATIDRLRPVLVPAVPAPAPDKTF